MFRVIAVSTAVHKSWDKNIFDFNESGISALSSRTFQDNLLSRAQIGHG